MRTFIAIMGLFFSTNAGAQWLTGDYTMGKAVSVFPGGVDLSTVTAAINAMGGTDYGPSTGTLSVSTVSLAVRLASVATATTTLKTSEDTKLSSGAIPSGYVDFSTITTSLATKHGLTIATSEVNLSTITTWLQTLMSSGAVPSGDVDLSTITTALAGKQASGSYAAQGANGDITSMTALRTVKTAPVTFMSSSTFLSSATFRDASIGSNAYVLNISSTDGTTMGGMKANGLTTLGSKSILQLMGIAPTVGDTAYCNNCVPKKIVVATGTAAGQWADAIGGTFK